jgi:carbamoyltransferase
MPEDAFRCFMGTDLDVLVIGQVMLNKQDQPAHLVRRYSQEFALD